MTSTTPLWIWKFLVFKCHRLRFRNYFPVLPVTLLLMTFTLLLLAVTALVRIISADYRSSCSALIVNHDIVSNFKVASQRITVGYLNISSSHLSSAFDVRFLVNANHLCDPHDIEDLNATSFPVYLIIVHSRPDEIGQAQRDAIRSTWASSIRHIIDDRKKRPDYRVVFVVGRPPGELNKMQATKLSHESDLYGDVVIADFIDNYRNLTIKSLVGMRWARAWCTTAQYVIKVDDDVYLRVDLLPKVVIRQWQRSADNDAVIVGSLNVNATVQRHGLWRVDRHAFPAERFPPYCSGNLYMMTSSAVDRLLSTAENASAENPVPLEDVFVTSILAASSGIQCCHDDAFPHWYVGPTGNNVWRMRAGKLVAVHNVDYRRMYKVDKQLYG